MDGEYSNVVLTGLTNLDGAENPSGLQEDAWIMVVSDMKTIAVPTPGVTPKSLLEIATNHVMATGKAPIPVYTMFDKSDFESPLTGELMSRIFLPAMTIFMPQPSTDNAAQASVLKNARLIVLFKRTNGTTEFIQVGSLGLYAKIKDGSVKFGKGPTGEPGVTLTIEAPSIHPFYVYKGSLPVAGV
jgi:hypothetical protein